MSVARLSKRTVDSLRPRVRPYIVFDEDLTGFGLRVMPSGTKTWIVEYRPGAGGRKVSTRRMKIDLASRVTPEQARTHAREILARVRLGEDPAVARATGETLQRLPHLLSSFSKSTQLRRISSRQQTVSILVTFVSSSCRRLAH